MNSGAILSMMLLLLAGGMTAEPLSLEGEIQRTGAWPFGASSAVDVDDQRPLVYLGSGGAVLVLDVSSPQDPVLVSQTLHTDGVVMDLFYEASDSILYSACGDGGIEIWDLSDPAVPVRLSSMEVLYFGVETPVGNVDRSGDYLVAECNFGGVHTIDVSNPANPQQVAFNASMGNPALDSEVDSSGTMHTTGAQYYTRLTINPDGSINGAGQKEFIYGAGTAAGNDEVAYVSYDGYLYILDLLLAGFPAWSITDVGGFSDIAEMGDHIFLVNDDGLQIWDVSSYSSPVLAGSLSQVPEYADRIVLKDNLAFVTNSYAGLSVIDISDLSDPAEIGAYDVYSISWATALQGDHAFVAHSDDGLLVLDITDPSSPELVGQSDTEAEARDVDLGDGYAYLAAWTDGLRIIDISDPSSPLETGYYDEVDAWRVALDGDVAWLVDAVPNQADTLRSFDVSDPYAPEPLGSLELYELTWELSLNGDFMYVASGDEGVRLIDISDPYSPLETGHIDLPSVHDVDFDYGLLMVTAFDGFDGGLFLYDADVPDSPAFLGSYEETGFSPWQTALQGDHAMVLDPDDIHLFDISVPSNPQMIDTHEVPGFILTELVCRDSYAFVSAGDAGVQVYENTVYTGIEEGADHGPRPAAVGPSYPNPFSNTTTIGYSVPSASRVKIAVYDMRGALVAELVDASVPAGEHWVNWDGCGSGGEPVSSGMYMYRLETGNGSSSGKMILIR